MSKQKGVIKLDTPSDILKKYFPGAFDRNGAFNFKKFKELINIKEIDISKESYELRWLGKSYARVRTFDEATTFLKEDRDWNRKPQNKNSQNLLIKGDNLEVLKHLVNAYRERIKMIYIDPPYNTGNDGFIYEDTKKFTPEELSELAGISLEHAKRILDFVNSKSNSHSAWLTFMYPRLYIARELLREDGVIFISIDDNEVAQLRLMMDEIFGEENFVNSFVWISNPAGRQIQGIGAATTKEYILCYSKDISKMSTFTIHTETAKKYLPSIYKGFNFTTQKDEKGDYIITHELHNANSRFNERTRPNLVYSIFYNPSTKEIRVGEINDSPPRGFIAIRPKRIGRRMGAQYYAWRWSKKRVLNYAHDLHFVKVNGEWKVFTKRRDFTQTTFKDIITDITTTLGSNDLKNYGMHEYFDYPKPVLLIKLLLLVSTEPDDIILDFFAGSGTTGDAVMQLNAEDGGNRKYILVQLPEPINPKKNKTAYDFVKNELGEEEPTIFHITKERLVRAAQKIKKDIIEPKLKEKREKLKKLENSLKTEEIKKEIKTLKKEIKALEDQDLGFKIFKTAPIWEDYYIKDKELTDQTTLLDTSTLKEEDLLTLLVTWKTYDGIPLTEDCQEILLCDYKAFYCSENLYLLLPGWKTEYLETLIKKIDTDEKFVVSKIIIFGYNFQSKHLREISENIKNYANKKQIEIETIIRV